MDKDIVIEIAQVSNGFMIRPAQGWFGRDDNERRWTGSSADYLVFRTMAELQEFVGEHFTHRSSMSNPDHS